MSRNILKSNKKRNIKTKHDLSQVKSFFENDKFISIFKKKIESFAKKYKQSDYTIVTDIDEGVKFPAVKITSNKMYQAYNYEYMVSKNVDDYKKLQSFISDIVDYYDSICDKVNSASNSKLDIDTFIQTSKNDIIITLDIF